ncbi:L,D-transpeptidase [Candidatus Fermentibacterales bacterium]|nr:L,D-transpeptidase [Candidatus Fermentibacterales bacterium]
MVCLSSGLAAMLGFMITSFGMHAAASTDPGSALQSCCVPGSPDPEHSRSVTISTDLQVALFEECGREENLALVSTGRAGYSTPPGCYEVQYRRRAPVSSTYMVPMPYWICIHPDGSLGLHQGPRGRDHLLGRRLSHGCVRLSESNARWAYYWLVVGSSVVITQPSPPAEEPPKKS